MFVVSDMTGLRQGLELLVITRMIVGVQIQELVLELGAPLLTNSLVEIEPDLQTMIMATNLSQPWGIFSCSDTVFQRVQLLINTLYPNVFCHLSIYIE